jgi:hypothetical protein
MNSEQSSAAVYFAVNIVCAESSIYLERQIERDVAIAGVEFDVRRERLGNE